jgi:acetoin:2,6-dichlorophenolindophenol oxidoreductase subunit alpha
LPDYSDHPEGRQDRETAHSEASPGSLTDERAAQFLRRMWEIRAFEEAAQRLFTSGHVRGSTPLCQGREAVVVGACEALRHGDSMLCTYRGHGAVLAALRHAEAA